MKAYLPFVQLIISVLLIASILLQQRGTAMGSALGQESGFYATRRGIQKKLLWLTIVLGFLFFSTALLSLYLRLS